MYSSTIHGTAQEQYDCTAALCYGESVYFYDGRTQEWRRHCPYGLPDLAYQVRCRQDKVIRENVHLVGSILFEQKKS